MAAAVIPAWLLVTLPGAVGASTTAAGYEASNYATGFPEDTANHWGPIGIAFDRSDNLYVADTADGNIYRFQPGGGTASPATRLTSSPIPGHIEGLVATGSGQVYLARYQTGDVVQIDPGTGAVLRTVASVPCATGLAIDPVSGDLFVSQNLCGSTIYRVSGFQNGSGTVSAFATAHGVDGLAFDQDGTLYAESDGHVLQIAGTNSPTPGAVSNFATVPHADGLAFGAHSSGNPPYLVANRNDGIVTKVDFSSGSQTDIFSGGSRGDFAAVDSRGCLYITQSASIVRISGSGDACALEPSTPGPAPRSAVIVNQLQKSRAANTGAGCKRIQSLQLRVHQQGRVRLRSATVYVDGRVVKRMNGAKVTAPFTLTRLPKSAFAVKVVAVTTDGKQLVTTRRYANCTKPSVSVCTSTRQLIVKVPQRKSDPARLVDTYVNGRRTRVVRGRSLEQVTLLRLPHGRFTVKLTVRYARGRPAGTSHTYVGC